MLFYLVLYSKKVPIQQNTFSDVHSHKIFFFWSNAYKGLLSPVLTNWVISNFYIMNNTVQNNYLKLSIILRLFL